MEKSLNTKNKNLIRVNNIYLEDLFKWSYESVIRKGGDGASLIICQNYLDGAKYFKKWAGARLDKWKTQKYDNSITIYSWAESFIFSNEMIGMPEGDYTFIIDSACYFGFGTPDPLRVLLPVF